MFKPKFWFTFDVAVQTSKGSSINHVTPKSRLTLLPRDAFVTIPLLFLPTNQNAFWPILV